ncbi:sigma-54 interaction domain-containing protein [Desulfoplanes sp.]
MAHSPFDFLQIFTSPTSLGLLLDPLPVGVAVVSPDLGIIFMNTAMEGLTGFSRSDIAGKPCYHVLRSNLCMDHCPVKKQEAGTQSVCLDGNILDKNREKIPTRHSIARVKDENGHTVAFIESVEDLRQARHVEEAIIESAGYKQIIGQCPSMDKIFEILPVIAQTDSSVLITGETGTGKDLVAESVHQHSSRAKGPFIKVNCGALPENLLESELFGHRKGAFTGAVENKPGWFKLAHNGTLFLTEVGDLPLALQVKLLTFLDDKVIYPLGSTRGRKVNVRVIAATHRDLEAMVGDRRFRQDLLFRLNVIRVEMPPLRERGEDLPLLINHFVRQMADQLKKNIIGLDTEAMRRLSSYSFPGNVRELRNIIEYAVTVCQGQELGLRHLPAYVRDLETDRSSPVVAGSFHRSTDIIQQAPPAENWTVMERQMIMDALVRAGGRKSKAADILGWGRSTLWRKMKKHNLE